MINFYLRFKNKKQNGFSTVELIIAIVIIGLLGSISIPTALKWVDKEKQNAYVRELISYFEMVKKETRRWNGRCSLETTTKFKNDFDPLTNDFIGFQAFNVKCYGMNDSEIKNIINRVPKIEHRVFQEVNMRTFNFSPNGHLSIPGNQNDLVIIIGGRPASNNYYQRAKCILVSPPMGLINTGHTRSEMRFYSGRYASRENSGLRRQSCNFL